ncbi:MAG: glycosyltransferase family 39 protein, partial [Candidatus Omnitrophica bacterium]|nr:glycosyltransferase family 39 protein [Candidatus Omnitrophota bacterium]
MKKTCIFLFLVYCAGVYFRLAPRLFIDSHLLTFNADIWERLAMAQYFLDHARLPEFCLRYLAYGDVPFWYPPFGPVFLALLSILTHLDLPTVCSRAIPFIEALTPIPYFFLVRYLYSRQVAYLATLILALTPSFVYWTGIATPQSFTLFMIPLYFLFWIDYIRKRVRFTLRQRGIRIVLFGAAIGINFLFHLTYYVALVELLCITLVVSTPRQNKAWVYLDLITVFAVSQLMTMWWWLPKNLYWWWIHALVTSSVSVYSFRNDIFEYGVVAALLGACALVGLIGYSLCKRNRHLRRILLFSLLWMFFPLLETQMERILITIQRVDLTWETLWKPFEGFRFFCFLAQPVALISALGLSFAAGFLIKRKWSAWIKMIGVCIVAALLLADIHLNYQWYAIMQ